MKLLHRWAARIKRSARIDSGSTMVTVIVVMLVLTIGGLTLAAVAMNSTRTVTDTRHRTSAQAEVDGAIAMQTVALTEGRLLCDTSSPQTGTVRNGNSPHTVEWTLECSLAGQDGTARLTAEANVDGVGAAREAVFSYRVVPPQEVGDAALITKAPLDLAALTIKAVDPSSPADVWVVPDNGAFGDFRCDSGGAIAGSVYLPEGKVFGAGGCKVDGDVYSQKDISIGSGTQIGGDLVSLEGNVNVSGGVTISGSIFAAKNVSGTGLSSKFVQNIHAVEHLSLAGGAPSARGNITYGGAFNPPHSGMSAWAQGTVTNRTVLPPEMPPAAKWEGISQDDLDGLVDQGLFDKITWTGSCTHAWYPEPEMRAKVEALTTPTIIDARACPQVDIPGRGGSGTLKLQTDVIFVAPSFNLEAFNFDSADGNEHKVWMIAPETGSNNCSTVPPVQVKGVRMIPNGSSKITGMIFTECTVHFANANEQWQGSIQAGTMTGKPNFWYKPIAFPGRESGSSGGTGGSGGGNHVPGSFRMEFSKDLPAT